MLLCGNAHALVCHSMSLYFITCCIMHNRLWASNTHCRSQNLISSIKTARLTRSATNASFKNIKKVFYYHITRCRDTSNSWIVFDFSSQHTFTSHQHTCKISANTRRRASPSLKYITSLIPIINPCTCV